MVTEHRLRLEGLAAASSSTELSAPVSCLGADRRPLAEP